MLLNLPLLMCGWVIHMSLKLLSSKYLMAHPAALFGMHLSFSAHLGLAMCLLWPVECQKWADVCPGSGTSGVPRSGSWWLYPPSLGPASNLMEQTGALDKPIVQSAVALWTGQWRIVTSHRNLWVWRVACYSALLCNTDRYLHISLTRTVTRFRGQLKSLFMIQNLLHLK